SLGIDYKIIDAEGALVTPGFIDPHVHFLGGGGEGGFATRTPEIQISDLIQSGITSAAGLIGTDGTTRHLTSLLAKPGVWKSKEFLLIFIPVIMMCRHRLLLTM